MSDDLMNEVNETPQYDNTNSGAAFATTDKDVMRGVFNFGNEEGVLLITKRQVEDQTMYALVVTDEEGELLAGGSMAPTDLITNDGTTPNDVDNPHRPPKFRGTIKDNTTNEEIALVSWLARNKNDGSLYLQFRPDGNRTDVANF
jgi:hypothetical protein